MSGSRANHAFLIFSGTNDRAVYALSRAIAACGESLAIVARSSSDKVLLGKFRSCVVSVRDGDELNLGILWRHIEKAKDAVGAENFTIVPISEYFNTFLLDHRDQVEDIKGCGVPLVCASLYQLLTNKRTASQFFAENGIAAPREFEIRNAAIPFVAKPRANIIDGKSLYPYLIESEAVFREFLAAENVDQYFFQQMVAGVNYYVLAYLSKSGEVFLTSQKNLAQQPNGKSILLAETAAFHRSEAAKRAIEALTRARFTGFVMLEFIVADDEAYFIELNPRPWGPLELCADHQCGIIEAFIGESAHGDAHFYAERIRSLPVAAKYMWLGGALQSLRTHGGFDHRNLGALETAKAMVGALGSDVYLRRDSWRVFVKEAVECPK